MRQMNQDYIYSTDQPLGNLPNLFIVADGMGGHKAGDFASKFTVERVVELVSESEETDPEKILGEALRVTNQELIRQAYMDPEKQGMGTTFVAATIAGKHLRVFNVGDSRLYLLNHQIEQVTQDHSYVQEMVQKGELNQEDARLHPRKNVITRAIGASPELVYDFFERQLSKADEILLCSDGLTNMLEDTEIQRIVKTQPDPIAKVDKLIEAANEHGGADNISAILIQPN